MDLRGLGRRRLPDPARPGGCVIMKLATCQCARWPDSPCRSAADAEDLLCAVCRAGCGVTGELGGKGIHVRFTDRSRDLAAIPGTMERLSFAEQMRLLETDPGATAEEIDALRKGILKLGEAG
jgi:hypothetical protein